MSALIESGHCSRQLPAETLNCDELHTAALRARFNWRSRRCPLVHGRRLSGCEKGGSIASWAHPPE